MALESCIVAGMWGTTNLTLSLLDSVSGRVVAEKVGEGISMLGGRTPEDALFSLIEPWANQYDIVGIELGGMVGSTLGWIDVPYLQCPINLDIIPKKTFTFNARGFPVSIVPGLSCRNPFGHPDVMRGEETELFSWLATATEAQKKNSILCVPGTHAKWVQVKNSEISTFFTSVVGEAYQVISANGVLAKPHYQKSVQSSKAFLQAVKDIAARPQNLMNLLFTTRAYTVTGKFTDADATDYLSGLLIGADINAAVECFDLDVLRQMTIPLIGAKYLIERYADGLAHWGISSELVNAAETGAKGLFHIYKGKNADMGVESSL